MEKYDSKIDVAVLIIFFCRYEQLEKVFEAVKKARPSKLYLYQDGARVGREDDVLGIDKCRDIVKDDNIDWKCEVHRYYQNENKGCDPSCFIAHKWMFENEEMGIVLEDDVVPAQAFFPFCKELLERYKDNDRINMICGMNNTDVSEHIKDSYLFTKKGSIWGWASWRRVLDTWDGKYTWLDDPQKIQIMRTNADGFDFDAFLNIAKKHHGTGREHHESINAAAMFLYNRINIVPKYNMISNIGIAEESTHSVNDIRLLPRRMQKLLFKKTYEIDFPLVHPTKIERDYVFEDQMTPSKVEALCEIIEHVMRYFIFLGPKKTLKKIRERLLG